MSKKQFNMEFTALKLKNRLSNAGSWINSVGCICEGVGDKFKRCNIHFKYFSYKYNACILQNVLKTCYNENKKYM